MTEQAAQMPTEMPAPRPAPEPSVEDRINAFLAAEEPEEEPASPAPPARAAEPAGEEQGEPQKQADAKPEGDPGEASEELTISSMKELAEHVGLEMEDLYALELPFPAMDGESEGRRMTIGEWKDSVTGKKFEEYATKSEQVAAAAAQAKEAAEAQQQAVAQMQQWMTQQTQQVQAITQAAEGQLAQEYQGIDWKQLREYDPAEFAVKQEEFRQRQAQIEQIKQGATQQAQQAQQQMLQQVLPQQHAEMLRLIPEWKDESTAKSEKRAVASYLTGLGYSPEEVGNLYDARTVSVAYKAMKYDELRQSKPGSKKVLKVGKKPIKPGKTQSRSEQRESALRDQRARLKKSGSINDMAALLNTDEYLGDIK